MSGLKKSEVVFNEREHTYHRGEEQLSGITKLIKSVLQLGVYPTADEYVKECIIPRAGYYGTCVHEAIETYETLGVEATEFPAEDYETEHHGTVTFPAHDVSEELQQYINFKAIAGAETLAVEFTVDYGQYATKIDTVWEKNGEVYLVDHKTNNLDYYPGGAEGLQQYLSWQLSCNAFMFERQTGRKVAGLWSDWHHKGEAEMWQIERQSDEDVENLLSSAATLDDNGEWHYVNEQMQRPVFTPVKRTADDQWLIPEGDAVVLAGAMRIIADIKKEADEAQKKADELKARLLEAMQFAGVKKWETDSFTATAKDGYLRDTFDSKRFREDHPDLYDDYVTQTEVKPSITIKLK